ASRVALTARTPSELVVDTPGLMSFGAYNVQSSESDDFVVLLVCLLLYSLVQFLVPNDPCGVVRRQPLFFQLFLGQILGIAAKQYIAASAGHVGSHRHSTFSSGLGHDHGFLLVVFGVENAV